MYSTHKYIHYNQIIWDENILFQKVWDTKFILYDYGWEG